MVEDFLLPTERATAEITASSSPETVVCTDKISFQELLQKPHADSFSPATALSTEHIVSHYSLHIPSKSHPFFSWLKESGYTHLIHQLTEENYQHFFTVRHPLLVEQLLAIKCVCAAKFSQNPLNKERCLHFAIDLAEKMNAVEQESRETKAECVRKTKYILAQFLLLLDQDPALGLEMITHPPSVALPMIQNYCQLHLLKMHKELADHALLHEKTKLQPSVLSASIYLPTLIAKYLITSTGKVNFGLIDFFSSSFIKNQSHPINHEASLIQTLKLLQNSPVLRYHIQTISPPPPSNTVSSMIIRTTLGIAAHVEINDYHTRVTALSAILSHLRQEGEGSCFATSLAIEILSGHLQLCVKDLKHILEKGTITRKIEGEKKNIPFMYRIKDPYLHTPFSFDVHGSIYQGGEKRGKLWEAPGMQSACTVLGLNNTQEEIERLLSTIPSDKKGHLQHKSMMDLFFALCQINGKTEGDLAKMSFVFSSQTAHPLLKTWENAIAGMAEMEEKSLIRSKNLQVLSRTLQQGLEEQTLFFYPLSLKILEVLKKKFKEVAHFQYDPAVPEKNKGGFILYSKENRVDTAEKYQLFLKEIVKEIEHSLLLQEDSEEERLKIEVSCRALSSYVASEIFLIRTLRDYHKSNQKIKNTPFFSYDQVDYAPWMTLVGNDSRAVLKIYFSSDQPINTKEFTENNASKALENIIQLCREMSEEEKINILSNPHHLKPFCILGKHRLPFMPGHPSLVEAWSGNIPSNTWILSRLILPGTSIGKEALGSETKKKVLEGLQEIYPASLTTENIQALQKKIKNFSSKKSFKKFRNFLLESVDRLLTEDESQKIKFTRKLDSLLYESLHPDLKKRMQETAIHFADTNWSNGVQDIHFCFVFNPGSSAIELWEVDADGNHLRALDQKEWLDGKKWQFFLLPKINPTEL